MGQKECQSKRLFFFLVWLRGSQEALTASKSGEAAGSVGKVESGEWVFMLDVKTSLTKDDTDHCLLSQTHTSFLLYSITHPGKPESHCIEFY